jgi:hypothetical protein
MDCFVADAPRNDGTDTGARSFETVIASQRVARMRARPSLRAKRSNPEPQERMDCFVADAPRNDNKYDLILSAVFAVIASEAKQSISPNKERMDCFVASLPCANASRLSQAMTTNTT